MSLSDDVKKLVAEFERENPTLKGRAKLTSGSRTWREQLNIILQPKRRKNYPNIKARFKRQFKLKQLPTNRFKLNDKQLEWWHSAIMEQAGKPDGFAHVGGKAQDVFVGNLSIDDKKKLKEKIETKFKILLERVTETKSDFKGVVLSVANTFHVHE